MHYAYVDRKRVSNHLIRDFRTFLKLQEAVGFKQARAQGSIAYIAPPPPPLPNHGDTIAQGQPNMGSQSNGGYIQSKGHIAAMIQPVPKSKKEQRSISRQVNRAITLPPATTEYLKWSDQTVGFSRTDHPRKVPRPGHVPMVLKAQIGGYDVGRVFMNAGSAINLIYARTLKAMNFSLKFLQPTDCSLHGIVPRSANYPLGKIELDVCFGNQHNF
jgi:hypothetical protein